MLAALLSLLVIINGGIKTEYGTYASKLQVQCESGDPCAAPPIFLPVKDWFKDNNVVCTANLQGELTDLAVLLDPTRSDIAVSFYNELDDTLPAGEPVRFAFWCVGK